MSRIAYLRQESWWDPLSRDKDTMDGLNPHLAIADESHAHKNREAYDVIESHLRAWLLQRFKLKLRDLRFEELLAVAERTQKHPA